MAKRLEDSTIGRLSTGIDGLDALVDGGLVRGGVYLVMGVPGTGKTTLANQACFAHVARGETAAYVTLLAETHARMMRNLQPMEFYRPAVIGRELVYVGAYLVLRDKHLAGLLELLQQVLRDQRATLLVLDGLSTMSALGAADVSLKEFIAELQVLSDMLGCTTLVLANMTSAEANGAEHSMVDGLIELSLRRREERTTREIEVLKFRGVDHFLGRHDLEISNEGIHVRPRLEMLSAKRMPPAPATHFERATSGVEHLDGMLGGGFVRGNATMLLGFSGAGKTLLGLHFLEAGASVGEPSLYFGFYESPDRLLEGAESVGLGVAEKCRHGILDVVWQPPLKYGLDSLGERLLRHVDEKGIKRLVIDGIDGFRQGATFPERTIRFITALVNELRARGVTTLLTEETQKLFGPEVEVRIEGLSALVDNILLLEYVDVGSELKRLLSVVKQRSSDHDSSVRELIISHRGLRLEKDGESARVLLGDSSSLRRQHRRLIPAEEGAHGAKR